MTDLDSLQQIMGVSFNNPSMLEQALVHSSYSNENPDFPLPSNERLEFLGDAILGFVIAEKLYNDYLQYPEGKMTKLRAALVRGETLARIARRIDLGSYLYMGKGEEMSGGRNKSANLAAAMEAVIAVVYFDQGMSEASDFILRLIETELTQIDEKNLAVDYKSELQELIQSSSRQAPTYHVINTTGPDHGKIFTVEVRTNGIVLGKGNGKNKKAAETDAARSALENLPATFTE
ncbi:ribonuclease III [Chloroflexota bacterium]